MRFVTRKRRPPPLPGSVRSIPSWTRSHLPRVVVVVDLYGQTADYERILAACGRYGVPVVADSAEAIGATYRGRMAGSMGTCGVFSFNGNKILTTSGGGMLVSHDVDLIDAARFLATQARDHAPHYQHSIIGYNYRLSNLLAALGRAQLKTLGDRIEARRRNSEYYREALGDLPGLAFMPLADWGAPNYWLTCITIDPQAFGATREDVRLALEAQDIESRPVWKPLHLQPVFTNCRTRGGAVSEAVFERGLCLPSGSSLTQFDLERVSDAVRLACLTRPLLASSA
jgi:dTDP-4-amino-4,6-dideoxygalactose transaminase